MAKGLSTAKAGTGHNAAAKPASAEVAAEQQVKPAGENLNNNAAEQPKGPDNNKRLASLEAALPRLAGALGYAGVQIENGDDVIGMAVATLEQLGGARGQIDNLANFLLGRPGFAVGPDEGAGDSAIRTIRDADARMASLRDFLTVEAEEGAVSLIGENEDEIDAAIRIIAERNNALATASTDVGRLTSLVKALTAKVEVAEKGVLSAAETIGRIYDFILSHADFQPVEGEALDETVKRFVETIQAENRALYALQPVAEPDALPGCNVYDEVAVFADLDPGQEIVLRFADGDVFVGPSVTVDASHLQAVGGRGLYQKRVDFPSDGSPSTVSVALLVAGEKAVRCELPGGLRIGGGAQAAIPAGHLIF